MEKKYKCACCGKEIEGDPKVLMHHDMHRYVCSSKCMINFYKGKKQSSYNRDYAVPPAASPKLPSLKEVQYSTCIEESIIEDIYNIIKQLGNFA